MAPEHEDSISVIVAWFFSSRIKENLLGFFPMGGMVESFLHPVVESFFLSIMWHGSSQALNREFVQRPVRGNLEIVMLETISNYAMLVILLHFLQS